MSRSRLRAFAIGCSSYLLIVLVTLVVVDVACIALGLFPPRSRYGDPDLGWRPARATGQAELGRCTEFASGVTYEYARNEDGIRTRVARSDTTNAADTLRVAVVGDSHTELCAPNDSLHSGVLAAELTAAGIPTDHLTYGVGRYSPLQAYLAYRTVLRPYHPRVLVLNFYTGNDFNDLFRIDDRPHLAPVDTGYRIAPPRWITLDAPGSTRYSRLLALARAAGDRTGIRPAFQRLSYLRAIGDGSIGDDLPYLRDLLKAREPSLGYPDALTAQMLNQQLFFHHYPQRMEEAVRRAQAVLRLARMQDPDVILVLSAIPSYQLVGETPIDSALLRVTARIPVDLASGIAQEGALYEGLRAAAAAEGWIFVDNLAALRGYQGSERLYNDFDYHLEPIASAIVGRAQRDALLPHLPLPQPANARPRPAAAR